MFPDNTLQDEINEYIESLNTQTTKLGLTPSNDFELPGVIIEDGTPVLITDIDSIEQWIVLFCTTPRDVYDIYKGTDFGTSFRKLFGSKRINNGYSESELEREIKEGLPLNPAIKEVRNVEMEKEGRYLNVTITTELWDSTIVDTVIEKFYILH